MAGKAMMDKNKGQDNLYNPTSCGVTFSLGDSKVNKYAQEDRKYLVTRGRNLCLVYISLTVNKVAHCNKRTVFNIYICNKIKTSSRNLSSFYNIIFSHNYHSFSVEDYGITVDAGSEVAVGDYVTVDGTTVKIKDVGTTAPAATAGFVGKVVEIAKNFKKCLTNCFICIFCSVLISEGCYSACIGIIYKIETARK